MAKEKQYGKQQIKSIMRIYQMEEQFNSYKNGINLDFLRQYCIHNGRVQIMKRGTVFQQAGIPSRYIGYIEKGCFKYRVHNNAEEKDYITGFAFGNEFVADYPNCLYGTISKVQIESCAESKVYIVEGNVVLSLFTESVERLYCGMKIMEGLFEQVYSSYIDLYSLDAHGRYKRLMKRCPRIVQQLSLKDIASYLKLHPNTISKIRHSITFTKQ